MTKRIRRTGRQEATPVSTTTTIKEEAPMPQADLAPGGPAVVSDADTSYTVVSVPDKSYADSFIPRTIHGVRYDKVFDAALAAHHNILIEGPTGSGKTSAVLAWAASRRVPMYSIPSSVELSPTQLFGQKTLVDGSVGWIDGPVTYIVRHGGVLLWNEINFTPERVGTAMFGLLDKRRELRLLDHGGETIQAHPDLLIVADMNPDYLGTRPLNAALRNRFAIQETWGYDPKVEQRLIRSNALREMAAQLRGEIDAGSFDTPCSTNMLVEFEQHAATFGIEFAMGCFVSHFASDERAPVRLVLDTWKVNIDADLQSPTPKAEESPGATDDDTVSDSSDDFTWDELAWADN